MYLKRITLRGFKSFGNKSQLYFESGVSVIVGPNGSGKSNVADAISWVLGEQSPKSLRGSSMGDVIFRSKKEERGIAEVSLYFDNSDRLFNLEFGEVKITRRVYSEGGSEYYINSSPCRLFDLQEMISDAGIGKGIHIIINQGQVNEIALLKPEDRKLMIDEVIGISKHKNRRNKSLVKLERVNNDIARLDDLLKEIKRTMDPLEIEAKKARRYAEISNMLKEEELSLFLLNITKLNKLWEEEEQKNIKYRQDLKNINDRILGTEKEKSNFIKLINNKQNEFNGWKNRMDYFNSASDQLGNVLALTESKKNVFSTLYNMFDLEFKNGKEKREISKSIGKIKNVEYLLDRANYIDNVFFKIEEIEKLFLEFFDLVSLSIDQGKEKQFIRDKGNYLREKIGVLVEDIKTITVIPENKETEEDINIKTMDSCEVEENVRKISFEERIEIFKNLKILCQKNLEKSQRLLRILSEISSIKTRFKIRLEAEYEKKFRTVSEERNKIEEFNYNFRELNDKKLELENNLYKISLNKENLKEKVRDLTVSITDTYNMPLEYISKNYEPSSKESISQENVRKFKNELKKYSNVNPNAAIEFGRIKKRYDFLNLQKEDLSESKNELESLIKEINIIIRNIFLEKFEQINQSFKKYFKALFPYGEGEMYLEKRKNPEDGEEEISVELKIDIGNSKIVSLSLLSGGEKTLVAIAFLFSIFSTNPSPFYVFDEADAALDDANIDRFLSLIKKFSEKKQIIIITHQKKTMEIADTIYGITMQSDGISKIISEKISKEMREDAEVN